MDYEALSRRTRNLEQEYTRHILSTASERVRHLESQLEIALVKLSEAKGSEDRLNNEIARLNSEIAKLNSEVAKKDHLSINNNTTTTDRSNEKALNEIRNRQNEMNELIREIKRRLEDGGSQEVYQARIKALEREVEELRMKGGQQSKQEKTIKEQRDSIVLLKDTVETSGKTLQQQKREIEVLKEEIEKIRRNPLEGGLVSGFNSGFKSANSGPLITSSGSISGNSGPMPTNNTIRPATEAKPTANSANPLKNKENIMNNQKKRKPKALKTTTVNVNEIIKEDNGFFNDLSFSNSSPVAERTFNGRVLRK